MVRMFDQEMADVARKEAADLDVRFLGHQEDAVDGPGFWMFQDDQVTRSSFAVPANTPMARMFIAVEGRLASLREKFYWEQRKFRLSVRESQGDGFAAAELEAIERGEVLR